MNAVATIEQASVALRVFDSVPAWACVHALTDRSAMPLFRPGEVAVYEDHAGLIPEHGGLYVVEFGGVEIPGTSLDGQPMRTPRRRSVMQADLSHYRDGCERWCFRTYAGPFHWADGPYADNFQMARKVLGPVVGIYAPSGRV